MEEVLLMDMLVKPEVIPHNVTHAFLVSIILIVTALIVRGSLKSRSTGHPELRRNDG